MFQKTSTLTVLAVGFLLAIGIVNARPGVQGRSLLQSVDAPTNAKVLRQFHAIGTQNYTSGANSKHEPAGAVADMYSPGTTKSGRHYFIGSQPYFEVFDPATGNVLGSVKGTAAGKAPQSSAPNDGGFGSVDQLLLTASGGTGVWQNVNVIQRVNTLGGVVPTGLFTLPAFQGINNALLAIPYQADYIFYVPA